MDPPDLTELLGITPFIQLVPKQDLILLVSYSRVDSQALNPQDFLPQKAKNLLELVNNENDVDSEPVTGFFDRIRTKFRDFTIPEFDVVKYQRPVIAGENEVPPELPNMSNMFKGLYNSADCVAKSDLMEFGDTLDLSDLAADRLHILNGTESEAEVLQHMELYKDKFELEVKGGTSDRKISRKCGSEIDRIAKITRITRLRITLDQVKLQDSKIMALYNFLDDLLLAGDLRSPSNSLSHNTAYVTWSEQHGLVPTTIGLRQISVLFSEIVESLSTAECDAEYLKEIQTLCLSAIRYSETCTEKDTTYTIMLSIEASSLLLLVLNTNPHNRELHLQSYIDGVVGFFVKNLTIIAPSRTFDSALGGIIDCLEKLCIELTLSTADDQTLTQVEYMCIRGIFGGCSAKASRQLRDILTTMLSRIFKKYASQRLFIINEILSNISKLATQKGLPRDIQLTCGVHVLFFSVFLINLVQTFDASPLEKDVVSFLAILSQNDDITCPNSASRIKREHVLGEISAAMDEAAATANQIVDYFLTRMASADAVHRAVFLGLIEDLCAMMASPEWPSAEIVTSIIVQRLVAAMNSQSISTSEEPYVLELLGKFGLECLTLKLAIGDFYGANEKVSSADVTMLFTLHGGILHHLKEQSYRLSQMSTSFRFQLLKTIVFYKRLYDDSKLDVNAGNPEEPHQISEETTIILRVLHSCLSVLGNENMPSTMAMNASINPSKTYKHLTFTTTFDKIYTDFLDLLTVCLETQKVKLAAKAIRILSPLVTCDPKILLHHRINASISKVLSARSALSKDAVIDLLGQYMFSTKGHIAKYHVLIGNMASDDGILVRKRVMKIMHAVFEQADEIGAMTFAAMKVLERLEDEELSLVELAKTALKSMFFLESQHKLGHISQVMIDLATSSHREIRRLLMSFLKQELRDSTNIGKDRFGQLKRIFNTVFDQISEWTDSGGMDDTEKAFNFVAALAECDLRLVTQDQLISLQPFLVDEVLDKEEMCLSALRILRLSLPNTKALRTEYVLKTNSILLQRLTKFQTRELHEAVQVIEVFSKSSGTSALTKAAISSMKLLWPHVMANKKRSPLETSKIRKVMHLLGCFASYCDLEALRDLFRQSNVGLRTTESVVSLVSRFLLYFSLAETDDILTKATAIKNLLCVASHHSRLFLSQPVLNVLDTELASSSVKIKVEIVRGLTSLLTKEDEKVSKNSENTRAIHGFGIAQDTLTDGICSSVIQRYIGSILGLCLEDVSIVGEASVLFLQVVSRLGYANPKQCIPTIIALEASPQKSIKRIATELHMETFQKHESLADRSYAQAITLACGFLKRTAKDGHLHNYLFLRSVYRVVNTTYLAKKRFIHAMIRLFPLDLSLTDLGEAVSKRDVSVFLALNLLVLNFTSTEEVFLLLFYLDRFITGDGLDLGERIAITISSKDGKGMLVSNLQLLFVFLQTVLALVYLRHNLAASYCIRPGMMDGFHPSKPDTDLRLPPKVVEFVEYPVSELGLERKLSSPASFGGLFTRLIQMTRAYSG